jgi:hypothetical protein
MIINQTVESKWARKPLAYGDRIETCFPLRQCLISSRSTAGRSGQRLAECQRPR